MKSKVEKKAGADSKAGAGEAKAGAKAKAEPSPRKPEPPRAAKAAPKPEAKASPQPSPSPAKPAAKGLAPDAPKAAAKAKAPAAAAKSPAPSGGRKRESAAAPRAVPETPKELVLEDLRVTVSGAGSPPKTLRPKTFQQVPAQRDFGHPDHVPGLPDGYGEDKLVLMPKDPEYMFCYWEMTDRILEEKEAEKLPDSEYRETMKINWEAESLFEPNFTFVPVQFTARKWYFAVPKVGQTYQLELGWLNDQGHFISILQSNPSDLPESWARTRQRLESGNEVLSYTVRHTRIVGSSEHLILEDQRTQVPLWDVSSDTFGSSSNSSWMGGSPGQWAQGGQAGADRGAEGLPVLPPDGSKPARTEFSGTARLEVQGKVWPGTAIRIGGHSLSADAEGRFRIEFPYGEDALEIELESPEGTRKAYIYDLRELVLA